jgi:hypothetical protein
MSCISDLSSKDIRLRLQISDHSSRATLARNVGSNLETKEHVSKAIETTERRDGKTYVAVTVFVILDVVVVRFVIVRVDVPAVFVTVVLVATMVMGAGVIVVVLSTVARILVSFGLEAMRWKRTYCKMFQLQGQLCKKTSPRSSGRYWCLLMSL